MTGSDTLRVTVGQEAVYQFTVIDDSGDNFTVEMIGGLPPSSTLTDEGEGSYTFRWTLQEPTIFELVFTAVDSEGAASALTPLVEVCACINGGDCTLSGKPFNESSTVIMNCVCTKGNVLYHINVINVFRKYRICSNRSLPQINAGFEYIDRRLFEGNMGNKWVINAGSRIDAGTG